MGCSPCCRLPLIASGLFVPASLAGVCVQMLARVFMYLFADAHTHKRTQAHVICNENWEYFLYSDDCMATCWHAKNYLLPPSSRRPKSINLEPRCSKMAPKDFKMASSWSQDASQGSNMLQARVKLEPRWSNMAPKCSKMEAQHITQGTHTCVRPTRPLWPLVVLRKLLMC